MYDEMSTITYVIVAVYFVALIMIFSYREVLYKGHIMYHAYIGLWYTLLMPPLGAIQLALLYILTIQNIDKVRD